MKRAAFGVQMHSGWGVLVAVSADPLEIWSRRRIVTADPEMPGAIQPYHFAARLELPLQEKHLADCAASSSRLAASGRPLPALEKILAAHPLIHTAEGEFFRYAVRKAFADLKIPVTVIRQRELDDRANVAFGNNARQLQRAIAEMGSEIGPPWTKDHKTAALAAALLSTGRP
jgi:hypothetical protein